MLLLRPLSILGVGMIVLGFVLLLFLLMVQNKTKVDPLFYGTTRQTHTLTSISELKVEGCFFLLCIYVSVQYLQSFPSPAWWV